MSNQVSLERQFLAVELGLVLAQVMILGIISGNFPFDSWIVGLLLCSASLGCGTHGWICQTVPEKTTSIVVGASPCCLLRILSGWLPLG